MSERHDAALRVDRRTAVKWVLAAGAAAQLPDFVVAAAQPSGAAPLGYGKDPNLLKIHAAGDLWPLTLTDAQKRTTTVLCDLIIPADGDSPPASGVAVPEFIDEWISAPYPDCKRDREIIASGLAWLDAETRRRYAKDFAAAKAEQTRLICDDICNGSQAQAQFTQPAVFFARFRNLTALGYYTTPIGMKDLRYVGNEPRVSFDGPPPEVLKQLGL
ncbi:MAG: gluconate 2-dehydrogenase subunit 3 family protein [Steroidobacter sp.]